MSSSPCFYSRILSNYGVSCRIYLSYLQKKQTRHDFICSQCNLDHRNNRFNDEASLVEFIHIGIHFGCLFFQKKKTNVGANCHKIYARGDSNRGPDGLFNVAISEVGLKPSSFWSKNSRGEKGRFIFEICQGRKFFLAKYGLDGGN